MSAIPKIESTFDELKQYYSILNADKSSFQSSNDEPTPIECVVEMLEAVPKELWERENLRILDPCCGNGNFGMVSYFMLKDAGKAPKDILENILEFNDINQKRLENVRDIFNSKKFKLNITENDFLEYNYTSCCSEKYDLVMANPPYAKLMSDGKRTSKNHNLIKDFIEKSLKVLKPEGYLVYITPDNWMSYSNRNTLIKELTKLQIIRLDIHTAKKYFKKIGSSFTWYIIQNTPSYTDLTVSGKWKTQFYTDTVKSMERSYIPLFYNQTIQNILSKTVDNSSLKKFNVETSSDLHRYTKKLFISAECDKEHPYKLIHTPKQTVYSTRPHKFQEGYKVFISTTDKYKVFVDECGMTQSIVFIRCKNKKEAETYKTILEHPLYVFINNICRWGNFNNICILKSFPMPDISSGIDDIDIYAVYGLTQEEIDFIEGT